MHVPAASTVTVAPLTVQTVSVFVEYVTGKPLLALASGLRANVPLGLKLWGGWVPNVMFWLPVPMLTSNAACAAAL